MRYLITAIVSFLFTLGVFWFLCWLFVDIPKHDDLTSISFWVASITGLAAGAREWLDKKIKN